MMSNGNTSSNTPHKSPNSVQVIMKELLLSTQKLRKTTSSLPPKWTKFMPNLSVKPKQTSKLGIAKKCTQNQYK